jgi:hypothetical protein
MATMSPREVVAHLESAMNNWFWVESPAIIISISPLQNEYSRRQPHIEKRRKPQRA